METEPRYCILRVKKLKSMGAISRSLRHTFRAQPTPNADPSRRHENQRIGPARTATEGLAIIRDAMPEKVRKNGVRVLEHMITASPEAFADPAFDQNRFFLSALRWLKDVYGVQNVKFGEIHRDEATPHAVVYVVPLDEGKLRASRWLDGPAKMTAMQDSFYRVCGAPFGLARGIRRSNARHITPRRFYSAALDAAKVEPLTRGDYLAAAAGLRTERFRKAEQAGKYAREAAETARLMKRANEARNAAAELQKQDAERQAAWAGDAVGLKVQLNRTQAELAEVIRQRDEAERHRSELAQQVNRMEAGNTWAKKMCGPR